MKLIVIPIFIIVALLAGFISFISYTKPVAIKTTSCSPQTILLQEQMNQSCLKTSNKNDLKENENIKDIILACHDNAKKHHPCKMVTRHFYYANMDGRRKSLNTPCEDAQTPAEQKVCGVKN